MTEAEFWASFPLISGFLCGFGQENCKDNYKEKDDMLPLKPKTAKVAT